MIKKLLKVVLALILIVSIGAGYLYFRLHNDIDNILDAKSDWRSEVLEFPLLFAGDLDYEGEEHIRFAPGWGEPNSEDYFSYVFVWMIKEDPNLNPSELKNIISTYFDGLMNMGAITNLSFFKDIPETITTIQQIDTNTYQGTITLYDEFFSKKIFVLNAKIKNEYCSTKEKHLVWFYLSPQEYNHPIWNDLIGIQLTSTCD
ncbi:MULTISPECIES: hypothetical protein [Aquimarina]|uniref:Uncharacterized protein n=1 Tax=Aquimarina algiphila TaxID=2047982 RepID=A0A554VDQ9_9FLAO|nr:MULTISPECIES: hypothetical protein [Aquimarina]TSE05027.1 hypothetical protein FOF46_24110 [Aquimarina algiphila]